MLSAEDKLTCQIFIFIHIVHLKYSARTCIYVFNNRLWTRQAQSVTCSLSCLGAALVPALPNGSLSKLWPQDLTLEDFTWLYLRWQWGKHDRWQRNRGSRAAQEARKSFISINCVVNKMYQNPSCTIKCGIRKFVILFNFRSFCLNVFYTIC